MKKSVLKEGLLDRIFGSFEKTIKKMARKDMDKLLSGKNKHLQKQFVKIAKDIKDFDDAVEWLKK
jgi:predicted alpha/beta-fold hydrolase